MEEPFTGAGEEFTMMTHRESNLKLRWAPILTAFLVLACGCLVGPNYKPPAPPQVTGYTPAMPHETSSTADVRGGEAQRFVSRQDIPGEWWTLFHSQPLNDLIARALKASPDIKAAQAALLVARENVLAQRGAYFPNASAGITAGHSRTSSVVSPATASGALTYSLYTPQVSVSFVPDVFGLNRRTVESLTAQEQQARYSLAATHITLSSNIVLAAIQEASLREQIATTRELINVNTEMLKILQEQFAKGYVSRLDVAAQESQLAQVEATLPGLLKQLAQQRDQLVALSGGFPDTDLPENFSLSSLQLPQDLPVSLPSQLVEQRPDVRQAESNLHAASAQIGVAIANRLPSIALTADAGSMSLIFSHMFGPGTSFWDFAGGVTQTVFDGGTLLHKERAAKAAYVQASEQYRSTVITAFQNVADTLAAVQQDADGLKAATSARDAAAATLDLTKKQYQSGYVNYLSLLSAEQGYQQSVMGLVQAQVNRYSDTAALFQSLGGGWWNRNDIPPS
jgi:NodT family efflux transporter outer membrane factor (OMF) lipoprotein